MKIPAIKERQDNKKIFDLEIIEIRKLEIMKRKLEIRNIPLL